MNDAFFKSLSHCLGIYRIASCGNLVCKGYKPDLTVCNSDNQLVLIFECEQKTDRKAFLGDFVKAEKYAADCGALIPLYYRDAGIPEYDRAAKWAYNLRPYADWLGRLKGGSLNLADVLLISDREYLCSVEANELPASAEFSTTRYFGHRNFKSYITQIEITA